MGSQRLLYLSLWTCLTMSLLVIGAYVPLREYAGQNFFDAWDYYGFYDNTTWGNVTFVDRQAAMSTGLTHVNAAGNAIMKVDNTTFVQNGPLVYRNSVRITSKDAYGLGTLIMIDVRHIPFGCSVWPSFWTLGTGKIWPEGGEIDIIEGINMMNHNQIALHSTPGCFQDRNPGQTGQTLQGDCSTPQGCLVTETKPNSWGPGFVQAGGGVWATQIDVAGIFVWFWSRPDVPENIRASSNSSVIDTASWGPPTASYPANGCDIGRAGVPDIYASTCHTRTMSCLADNIVGPGSPTYDNAFWEISWIRTYNFNPAVLAGGGTTQSSSAPTSLIVTPSSPPAETTVVVTSVVQPTASESPIASSGAFRITALLGSTILASVLGAFLSL